MLSNYGETYGLCNNIMGNVVIIAFKLALLNIWAAYGEHMGNIWETYGEHMGNIWEHMGNIWETYGEHTTGLEKSFQ